MKESKSKWNLLLKLKGRQNGTYHVGFGFFRMKDGEAEKLETATRLMGIVYGGPKP